MALYEQIIEELFSSLSLGIKPGLERVEECLEALHHPEKNIPAIHITGTNGKGSAAAFASEILKSHGIKTGRLTSPHLNDFRERIALNDIPIAKLEVIERCQRIKEAIGTIKPTFFEWCALLAFCSFQDWKIDAAVVEVGMGGRWDATNVIKGSVGVITGIDLDHIDFLGKNISSITNEKIGILKEGMDLFTGPLNLEAKKLIKSACEEKKIKWEEIKEPSEMIKKISLPLKGDFQKFNAELGMKAAEQLLKKIKKKPISSLTLSALKSTKWPGRMEIISENPFVLIDAAHNPSALKEVFKNLPKNRPLGIIFGFLVNKEWEKMTQWIIEKTDFLCFVPTSGPRELSQEFFHSKFPQIPMADSPQEGLDKMKKIIPEQGLILATGSHRIIGPLLRGRGVEGQRGRGAEGQRGN